VLLGLAIFAGVALLVTCVLVTVFGILHHVIGKRIARERIALATEGIVLEERGRGSIRYRDYRAPGRYSGAAIRAAALHLVLTRSHFAMLGARLPRIPLGELHRYAVSSDGHQLIITTDNPVEATGSLKITLALNDAQAWLSALRNAGATLG
jgi:hypothetical protein